MTGEGAFADVLAANDAYADSFGLQHLVPQARRGLAVLTCIDSRIEPLAMLGLAPGDAKLLRNAGARVTEDVIRTLVLSRNLLGVERAMVVAHTDCRMTAASDAELHAAMRAAGAPDTTSLELMTTADPVAAVRADVAVMRSSPYLAGLEVGGFLYDVETGRLASIT